MNGILNELYHYMGLHGYGSWYGFWSGFAGDLTIFSAAIVFLWHRNCHVQGCWRLSWKDWQDPDGHTHALCKKHHPHDPPTADHIRRAKERGA